MREGWEYRPLGEVCDAVGGGTPSKRNPVFYEGDIPWATVRDMRNEFLSSTEFHISSEAVANSSTNIIPRKNVVIATRVGLGKVCLLEQDTAINQDLRGIIPKTGNLDVRFLFRWFQSIASRIQNEGTGATVKGVKLTFIKSLQLPLPPLPEQKSIVAILDEAFAGIDVAIANTEKNLANARELFESYLNSIFTLESGCSKRSFGDSSVLEIVDGDRGKNYPKKQDFSTQGHCLFLNTKNVRPDGFRFDSLMFISEDKDSALGKGKLKRRDVILTTRGTVGNVAIFDSSVKFDHVRINSGMLILRANEQVILADYLFELLRSPIVQSQISSLTTGAAQPQLPIKTLINFKIPIPDSLEMQRAFVSRIREFQTEFRRLESIYVQKHKALTELKQSLLQKAFTGELTAENMENEAREAVI